MNGLIVGTSLRRELLEHEVLILHLGDEACSLEQPLAVVPARGGLDRFPRVALSLRQAEGRRVDQRR